MKQPLHHLSPDNSFMRLPCIATSSACALGLLLFILSIRVISSRRDEKVSLGSGDSDTLERRIRAQANLAEYGPTGLILITLAELQLANTLLLGTIATIFIMGRIHHGYALGFTGKAIRPRKIGMLLTFFSLLGMIGLNLWLVITGGV